MAKLLPFRPRRHRHDAAAYVLALSARYARMSNRKRPLNPESLGNKLQRLALDRPAVVIVIENLVTDMLEDLDA